MVLIATIRRPESQFKDGNERFWIVLDKFVQNAFQFLVLLLLLFVHVFPPVSIFVAHGRESTKA